MSNEISIERAGQQETCLLVFKSTKGNENVVCGSLKEAALAMREICTRRDVGMADLKKNCGLVVKSFADRRVLARVSFNGRIWEEAERSLTLNEVTK